MLSSRHMSNCSKDWSLKEVLTFFCSELDIRKRPERSCACVSHILGNYFILATFRVIHLSHPTTSKEQSAQIKNKNKATETKPTHQAENDHYYEMLILRSLTLQYCKVWAKLLICIQVDSLQRMSVTRTPLGSTQNSTPMEDFFYLFFYLSLRLIFLTASLFWKSSKGWAYIERMSVWLLKLPSTFWSWPAFTTSASCFFGIHVPTASPS